MTRQFLMVALGFLLVGAGRASAVPITFTETVTADGVFDGTTFTDATITVTGYGDTSNRSNPNGTWILPLTSASVTVAGVGTDTIAGQVQIASAPARVDFVFEFLETGGLGSTLHPTIVGLHSTATPGFDLSSPFPQVTGTALSNSGVMTPTANGYLQITQLTSTTAAAQGTLTATPEPSTLALGLFGSLGGVGYFWRRHRRLTV